MTRFNGKAIVITGGSSGIGLFTAKRIAEEGGQVLVTGTNSVKLAAAKAIHPNIQILENDASQPEAADQLAAEAGRLYGKIDGAFFNAGIGTGAPIGGITAASYRHSVDLNVGGPLFGTQALVPYMRDGASVLITASTSAHKGYAGAAVYSATKGAVLALARSFAKELAPRIRVNTISPGGTETEFFSRLGLPQELREMIEKQIREANPMVRMAVSAEIAAVAAFLLSTESSFVTGSDYAVDGGETKL